MALSMQEQCTLRPMPNTDRDRSCALIDDDPLGPAEWEPVSCLRRHRCFRRPGRGGRAERYGTNTDRDRPSPRPGRPAWWCVRRGREPVPPGWFRVGPGPRRSGLLRVAEPSGGRGRRAGAGTAPRLDPPDHPRGASPCPTPAMLSTRGCSPPPCGVGEPARAGPIRGRVRACGSRPPSVQVHTPRDSFRWCSKRVIMR